MGFNSYRYAQRDYGFLEKDWQENHAGAGADSSLLFVLATTGLIGLMAYSWLWLGIYKLALKAKSAVFLASLTALCAHSFFLNSLFYAWIMAWLWMLVAVFELA